ncbi:hypothetical protein [Planctobacterium marinum]|uniref:hypothetical protein n=1 Tax=Planctobacterium marinum TaxID=1631968 RepID=UPI0030C74501
MKPWYKILILLEAIVGFGPLVILLGLGLITIPASFYWVSEGHYYGLVLLMIEIAGLFGLFAFISVLLHILEPNKVFLSPKKLRVFTLLGFIALFAFAIASGIQSKTIWFTIPIIVASHFMYLARNYLLSNS